jgi:hypothetical protein
MNFTKTQLDAAYDASCHTTIDLQALLDELFKISSDQLASFTEVFSLLISIVIVLKSDFSIEQRLSLLLGIVHHEICTEEIRVAAFKSRNKDIASDKESISPSKTGVQP